MKVAGLQTAGWLAERLGVTTQTIYQMRTNGRPLPPAIKVGKHLRYDPADVEAWIEQQKEQRDPAA